MLQEFVGSNVPKLDCVVPSACGNACAIWVKGYTADNSCGGFLKIVFIVGKASILASACV